MNETELGRESVFILYRQPDYDAFFEDPHYDGSPAQDEGQEWQVGVHATRERAEADKLSFQTDLKEYDLIIYTVDEYQLGELHWTSEFLWTRRTNASRVDLHARTRLREGRFPQPPDS